jgi:hypothetical protein
MSAVSTSVVMPVQDVSQLGGRNAAFDAMAVLDTFCRYELGFPLNWCCSEH